MKTYRVIVRATGQECYRYNAAAAISWTGLEFATHDHVEVDVVVVSPESGATTLTKLAYLRRFTQEERIAIRIAAESNAVLTDYLELLNLADEVNTQDVDTRGAVLMLENAGLIAPGRALEILDAD